MAVNAKSFLVLEKSLASRLRNSWIRETATVERKIMQAVQKGDFERAEELAPKLSLAGAAERNRKFAEFVGMQAVLFGASQLTNGNAKRTQFGKKPKQVDQGANLLVKILETNASESMVRKTLALIDKERSAQQDEAYKKKAATENFVNDFVSNVRRTGESFINISSSLHTSRLSGWGFTMEAESRGWTTYQVSEQLDSRTCSVCTAMNGRKFQVAAAKDKLENWLSTTDPDQLKSIAPWPSQDKTTVSKIKTMSSSELAESGWDTPPYHPLCRGILVKSGSVAETLPITRPSRQGAKVRGAVIDEDKILKTPYPNLNSDAYTLRDDDGNVIAEVYMSPDNSYALMVTVDKESRGKGIANGMYDYIESQTGVVIQPSDNLSYDGFRLWQARNPDLVADSYHHYRKKLLGKTVDIDGVPHEVVGVGHDNLAVRQKDAMHLYSTIDGDTARQIIAEASVDKKTLADLAAQVSGKATEADAVVTPQLLGIAEDVGGIAPDVSYRPTTSRAPGTEGGPVSVSLDRIDVLLPDFYTLDSSARSRLYGNSLSPIKGGGDRGPVKPLRSMKRSVRIHGKRVDVLQNPTPEQRRAFNQSIRMELEDRGLNPNAGVISRQTRDAVGNVWVWDADASIHTWMEDELSKQLGGTELDQTFPYVPPDERGAVEVSDTTKAWNAIAKRAADKGDPITLPAQAEPILRLLEELEGTGARVHADGTISVFHRTDKDSAGSIVDSQMMTFEDYSIYGSTMVDDPMAAGFGDVVVELRIPIENVHIDDIFPDGAAHLRVDKSSDWITSIGVDATHHGGDPDSWYHGTDETFPDIDNKVGDAAHAVDEAELPEWVGTTAQYERGSRVFHGTIREGFDSLSEDKFITSDKGYAELYAGANFPMEGRLLEFEIADTSRIFDASTPKARELMGEYIREVKPDVKNIESAIGQMVDGIRDGNSKHQLNWWEADFIDWLEESKGIKPKAVLVHEGSGTDVPSLFIRDTSMIKPVTPKFFTTSPSEANRSRASFPDKPRDQYTLEDIEAAEGGRVIEAKLNITNPMPLSEVRGLGDTSGLTPTEIWNENSAVIQKRLEWTDYDSVVISSDDGAKMVFVRDDSMIEQINPNHEVVPAVPGVDIAGIRSAGVDSVEGTSREFMSDALDQLAEYGGNPDEEVTIYRVVPGDVSEINAGDWVTQSKEFADMMMDDFYFSQSNSKVIKQKVRAGDLFWDGDSPVELGYNPDTFLRRISYELAPGGGSPFEARFGDRLEALPPSLQQKVTREVLEHVTSRGADLLGLNPDFDISGIGALAEMGGYSPESVREDYSLVFGTGGWERFENPAVVAQLLSSGKTAGALANYIGAVTQQTQVWTNHAKDMTKDPKGFGIMVTAEGLNNEDTARNLWHSLIDGDTTGLLQGYQPVSDTINGQPGILILVDKGGKRTQEVIDSKVMPQISATIGALDLDATASRGEFAITKYGNPDSEGGYDGQVYRSWLEQNGFDTLAGSISSDGSQLAEIFEDSLSAAEKRVAR